MTENKNYQVSIFVKYSRLSLSRSSRDPLKHFEISALRHIRFAGPRSAIGRAPDSYVRGPGFDTQSGNIFSSLLLLFQEAVVSYWRKYVHDVLVNRLGSLSLPRESVVRLTDRPDMTLDVYHGRKTTIQLTYQILRHKENTNRTTK